MPKLALYTTLVVLLAAPPSSAQAPATADPHLAPMARLIGGTWHLGEDSYHEFAWGVGGRSITSTSYFVVEGTPKKVSETTFLYHPGQERVVGHGVAIDMGIDFFGYDVSFAGDTITLELEAHGPAAGTEPQRETWIFPDNDHYEWTLYAQDESGQWVRRFGGTFERRR